MIYNPTYTSKFQLKTTIDWDAWLYGRGTPIWQPDYDQSLVETVTELRKKWVDWNPIKKLSNDFTSNDIKSLPSPQIMEFLNQLLNEEPLGIDKLEEIEKLYNLNANNNSEIKFRWIRLGLKSKWDNAIPRAIKMVSEIGRMKYLNPIYRYAIELLKVDKSWNPKVWLCIIIVLSCPLIDC